MFIMQTTMEIIYGDVIVKDVTKAPCAAGEWVTVFPDLEEIDKPGSHNSLKERGGNEIQMKGVNGAGRKNVYILCPVIA